MNAFSEDPERNSTSSAPVRGHRTGRRCTCGFQQGTFQGNTPCVFPATISENVLFGARQHADRTKAEERTLVKDTLKSVSLWEEMAHRLDRRATDLSVGQQQKLSFARTLAVQPDVLLLDEPTASLDPDSTRAIEELIRDLQENYPVVVVTHNIRQAKTLSDDLIFLHEGQVIEAGPTKKLFQQPEREQTQNYLNNYRCDCS